jgi:hypothetical protein
VHSKNRVIGNDSLDGGAHINGDTTVSEATEQSITGSHRSLVSERRECIEGWDFEVLAH